MSNSKQPINGAQTRVVQDGGIFYAQFSTDGLTWLPLTSPQMDWTSINQAVAACLLFTKATYELPVRGEVVWKSNQ